MDDNLSTKSSDSISTSGEYEIVTDTPMDIKSNNPSKSPTLNIANNGDFHDLQHDMSEAIRELEETDLIISKCDYELLNDMCTESTFSHCNNGRNSMEVQACILDAMCDDNGVNNNMVNVSGLIQKTASAKAAKLAQKSLTLPLAGTSKAADVNKVGHSVFYDCIDASPASVEKQDDMKPEKSDTDEEVSPKNTQKCNKHRPPHSLQPSSSSEIHWITRVNR